MTGTSRNSALHILDLCRGVFARNTHEDNGQSSTSPRNTILAYVFSASFSMVTGILGAVSGASSTVDYSSHGLRNLLRSLVLGNIIWKSQRLLKCNKENCPNLSGKVWFLGRCYNVDPEECSTSDITRMGHSVFLEDFSSRIWITYRDGYELIGDSYFTSDVSWGCMIRSSQMLVAQALLCHHLGRSWMRPLHKPNDPQYIEILHLFGDSTTRLFSLHNLLQAGKNYGLAAGSWVGPYAISRAWQTLICANHRDCNLGEENYRFPMAFYVVSGDQNGESGGAPVVCVDVASKLCSDYTGQQSTWAPILMLVPLVLGLGKVNPRYIPLLKETFTFPQSLGIIGGKPASSTYIVGIQGDNALYLDPHIVQTAVNIEQNDLGADTSSYQCSTIRLVPLEQIDSSLALGFYCRDKADFDDFCSRASELEGKGGGAPLFTVVQSFQPLRTLPSQEALADCLDVSCESFSLGNSDNDDEWEIV